MLCYLVSFFFLPHNSSCHSLPADWASLGSIASFSPPRIDYNIYLSLFEFTHPYHWVRSQWLWGGLVWDSSTLHCAWNMHITIKGDDMRGSISTRAHNQELMCALKCQRMPLWKALASEINDSHNQIWGWFVDVWESNGKRGGKSSFFPNT